MLRPAIPASSIGRPMSAPGRAALRALLRRPAGHASFGQTVIVTKGLEVRDKLKGSSEAYLPEDIPRHGRLCEAARNRSAARPPMQYRVSGPDIQTVRTLAQKFAAVMVTNDNLASPSMIGIEPARVLKVEVMQDKARQLGVSSQDIAWPSTRRHGDDGNAGPRRHLSRRRRRRADGKGARFDRRLCATCSSAATAARRCHSRRSRNSATSWSSRRSGAATAPADYHGARRGCACRCSRPPLSQN